jgi:hypothetical protein
MWNKILHTPLLYVYLFAGVVISVALGFYLSSKILLPVFQVAVSYPVLFFLLAEDRRNRAFAGMLFWAFCLAVITIQACIHFPERAGASILHGQTYVQEMFHWIRTGEGAEGNPMLFIPQHLLHFAVFCLLSALTASLLSLLMGAVLMNYMSYYVAAVIRSSTDVFTASLMGWHPWAIVRVISYVMLGVILAEPLICKIVKKDYEYERVRPFFWAAITGIALDILMKALMAPWWGLKLRAILR